MKPNEILEAVKHSKVLVAFHKHYLEGHLEPAEIFTEEALWGHILAGAIRHEDCGEYIRIDDYRYNLNSRSYTIDGNGFYLDGDTARVRALVKKAGKVQKVKPGRIMSAYLADKDFPEQVKIWAAERFTFLWNAQNDMKGLELHVDNRFDKIYDSYFLVGDFHSCMTDKPFYEFYEGALDASAAYLEDEDGMIHARCIIFNNVRVGDKVLRLAERQYAAKEHMKGALISALIKEGRIDGYKSFDAGCSDCDEFKDVNGGYLENRGEMSIDCEYTPDVDVPYMDSFKWAASSCGGWILYNYEHKDASYKLENTEGDPEHIGEEEKYDGYRSVYFYGDSVMVNCHGCRIEVEDSDEGLKDFRMVGGEYYHYEDVCYCERCEEYYLPDDGVYSEILDEHFCSECCMRDALEENAECGHILYSNMTDDFYDSEEELQEAEADYLDGKFYSYLTGKLYDSEEELQGAEDNSEFEYVIDIKRNCKIRKMLAVKLIDENDNLIGYRLRSEFAEYGGGSRFVTYEDNVRVVKL